MSTVTRTLGYIRRIGLKEYWHQLNYIGDTKAGTLIGTDKFGNKFYENMEEELPLRTRWVDYKKHDFDPAQIEPLWHMWISYGIDTPPTQDPLSKTARSWAKPYHIPNYTQSRGAYKPYSTTQPKVKTWQPVAAARQ
ncbi:putative nadh-ubiquinone oxidoreductase subunit protein [Phaeoacremonium minimum UCRPA7]|uniref:NADH dehydrogenase [ubiquinone] 1 alpha subcomplex subunit n=1 Tax=Phaeoacremonium minimum (strain UCR-PA7) TaxID=1286976 RepID=R8BNK4_PHAM7|nr:putative nadh-ubiquinone oxidoreductase subunit protein [Phaeoacremonium minimum UCRPA7]EOO00914.1 putative nadh-ubiquinone oxidoreductase subunit protein [Phaeoacremonium minimum UCRPA7]